VVNGRDYDDDDDRDARAGDAAFAPSRSQLKRDAAEVALLGRRLTELTPGRLAALNLDEELREAVETSYGLRRTALNRQCKRVAKLLRARDCDAIEATLSGRATPAIRHDAEPSAAEVWCARIIDGGDAALSAYLEANPEEDRQRLRQLARSARLDPESKRARRARRELLRAIEAAPQPAQE
jgi:ribosome-associated protein